MDTKLAQSAHVFPETFGLLSLPAGRQPSAPPTPPAALPVPQSSWPAGSDAGRRPPTARRPKARSVWLPLHGDPEAEATPA